MKLSMRNMVEPLKFLIFDAGMGLAGKHKGALGAEVRHNRLLLSQRYISGQGIEVGGLGRPLRVSGDVDVKYVDRFSHAELMANYPDMPPSKVLAPDIVSNGETLDPVADNSQDFVIANHVIEHFENPILFFHNAFRVLKTNGILFLALPNKELTFDRDRVVTPFDHLKNDFENGPTEGRKAHFVDFVTHADLAGYGRPAWETPQERDALVKRLMEEDYSIHFHVWDLEGMLEMITKLATDYRLRFRHLTHMTSGDEVVFVLRKSE